MLKGAAGLDTEVMFRLANPVLETVMLKDVIVPTCWLPKLRGFGTALIIGDTDPEPESNTVKDGFTGSLESIANDDVLNPPLPGVNAIVTVHIPNGASVPMQVLPAILKSARAGLTNPVIVNGAVPTLLTLKISVEVDPTAVPGKLKEDGFTLMTGVTTPVPLRFTVSEGVVGSLDEITKEDDTVPVLVGANCTTIWQLLPTRSEAGQLLLKILKGADGEPTGPIDKGLVPLLVIVIVC